MFTVKVRKLTKQFLIVDNFLLLISVLAKYCFCHKITPKNDNMIKRMRRQVTYEGKLFAQAFRVFRAVKLLCVTV